MTYAADRTALQTCRTGRADAASGAVRRARPMRAAARAVNDFEAG